MVDIRPEVYCAEVTLFSTLSVGSKSSILYSSSRAMLSQLVQLFCFMSHDSIHFREAYCTNFLGPTARDG